MNYPGVRRAITVGLATISSLTFTVPVFPQQKKAITLGPYTQTLKPMDSIDEAIARGRKLFNDLGCAGCHPRGGTIGGTAVDATGNRMNIPIPDLRGAALHYPRIAATGFVATVGIMNDL